MSRLYKMPLLMVIYFALYYFIEKFVPLSYESKNILHVIVFIVYVGGIIYFLISSVGDNVIKEKKPKKNKTKK